MTDLHRTEGHHISSADGASIEQLMKEKRMLGELASKIAVVTGGSRGIGREIALELAGSSAQTVRPLLFLLLRKISQMRLRASPR